MTPDNGIGYVAVGGAAAFFGIMARAARWVGPDGRFDWKKSLAEIVAAPCIGMIASGVGAWLGVDYIIMGGIASVLGLVGTAALEAAAIKWFDKRVGGV